MSDLSKDALAFNGEMARMCDAHTGCKGCPADKFGKCNIIDITPELIDAVQKWSDEHPPKTYVQDFREKFPNCEWWDDANGG